MKNFVKFKAMLRIAGIIALAAITGFSFAACGGGGGSSEKPQTSGGGGATYSVSWNDDTLTIVWGSIDSSQKDTIEKAMKTSDITMTPNDVITLNTITLNGGGGGVGIACTVLKSGTVKITLKPIAGYTFTKASWGEDTITVTKL
jgi:hypothetical protein